MDKKENARLQIEAPKSDKSREVARAFTEAIASVIPIAGQAVVRLLRVTHPSKSEQNRKEWQSAISERTNDQDTRLDEHQRLLNPQIVVEGLPAEIAVQLIKSCQDGFGDQRFGSDDIGRLFPEHGMDSIEEAVATLVMYGLLEKQLHLSGWRVHLSGNAFEQCDGQVMGWHTIDDAAQLARLILNRRLKSSAELHAATGWSKRRFNPALRYVSRFFDPRRVSNEISQHYVIPHLSAAAEDLARLKAFLGE